MSRDTGRSAATSIARRQTAARRRTAARRATAVMLVSSALLAVSPLGSIVAVAEDAPTTTTSPTTTSAPASDPSSTPSPTDAAPGSSDPATTTGPSSSTTNPHGPSVDTVDPTTTTTPGDSTTTSSTPPLAVSAILRAANPFDATHGFTVLARHAGELRAGTTIGAVAVGGDLRFGPYTITPTPPAQLDETPIGLLVGGAVGLGSSTGRLTVGDSARLLVGNLGTLQTAAVDGGVAVLPAGADVTADPQVRVDGLQDPQTVSSPGTFDRAFGGVFADLAARARTLAKLEPTLTPTAADGAAIASAGLPRADVHLAAGDGNGPSVWSVHAADLAKVGSITVDPAPTDARPLVINVDGDGAKVVLDRPVTVDAAARADIVWNVVDAKAVVVAQSLAGSLLAPTAPVYVDADVSGQVVADSVVQRDGTVGGTPFAAELPKVAEPTPTTDPPTSSTQPDTSVLDPAAEAIPETVPPATGNNAVITVKVGSDRPSASSVNPLPGVTLQLFDGVAAPTTAVPDAFATCVSDLQGDCSFTVPNTQALGANRDRRFWVVRTGTPTGWFAVTPFLTGANAPFTSTAYQFRTGDQLRAGNVYASSGTNATFMLGTGNTNNVASGGIWQSSRNNPSLPATCGLNVALVLDLSGSVAGSLGSLKSAAKTFTNSLVGTPSQVALFTFATTAPANAINNQNRPITAVSTQTGADTVNGWIDGLTANGGTNWDRGIDQVAESGTHFDIAIVITDGNPTFYGNGEGPGNFTRLRELENGIFSANTVKAEATRMVAVGVGAGVSGSPNNLISISGPTANSDYFQTNDYTAAGAALRALALGSCQGTISVVKQVVPNTAPPGSITGAVPAGGWQFGATTTTSGVAINPTSGTTAAASGALNFNLSFPGGTTTAPVTVAETQQAGYTLVQQGGLNATCRRLDTNAAVTVTNSGATGFLVTAATAFPVSCTVYNRAPVAGRDAGGQQEVAHQRPELRRGDATLRLLGGADHRRCGAGLGRRAHRLPAGRHDGAERDRRAAATAVHADEQPRHAGQWHPRVGRAPVHGHAGRRARTPTPSRTRSRATPG